MTDQIPNPFLSKEFAVRAAEAFSLFPKPKFYMNANGACVFDAGPALKEPFGQLTMVKRPDGVWELPK